MKIHKILFATVLTTLTSSGLNIVYANNTGYMFPPNNLLDTSQFPPLAPSHSSSQNRFGAPRQNTLNPMTNYSTLRTPQKPVTPYRQNPNLGNNQVYRQNYPVNPGVPYGYNRYPANNYTYPAYNNRSGLSNRSFYNPGNRVSNRNNSFPFGGGNMPFMNNNSFNNFPNNGMPFMNNNSNNNFPNNMFGNNNGKTPFFPSTSNKKRKKAWGDERNIWPDFYTDFTDDAWDAAMSGPRDLGAMPGGWRFPYLSTPDPVTVSDAITNQFPPIMEESGNMMDLSDWDAFK